MAHIEFPPEGTTQKSDEYLRLMKTGVIDTVSIGFIPHKSEPLGRGGLRITDWSLLEISAVAIPANPSAIVTARAHKPQDDFAKTVATRLNDIAKRQGLPPFASPSGRPLSDVERVAARVAQLRQQQTDLLLNQPRYRHLINDQLAERLRYIRGRSS
jgi:hypothetical protein